MAKGSGSILSDDFKQEVLNYFTRLCSHVPPIKKSCTTRLTDFAYKASIQGQKLSQIASGEQIMLLNSICFSPISRVS